MYPFNLIVSALVLSAGLLCLVRFLFTFQANRYIKKDVPYKLLGWYGRERMILSSSEQFKRYMGRFNAATIAMWVSALLAVIVLFLKTYFVG